MADDYATATGQWAAEHYDIAVWNGHEQEWQLKDCFLTSETEGRERLARLRASLMHGKRNSDFRLVYVEHTTKTTEIPG